MAAARREVRRRVLIPPPAPAPAAVPRIMRRGRDRERTDLPAFLMLLGASVVVLRSTSAAGVATITPSSAAAGDCVLAGFLLWLLGVMLLFFHGARTLRRFFVVHQPPVRFF